MSSKNSIEHVFPQTPETEYHLFDGDLDSFGNLALLNTSQNSSYGDKLFLEKKILFDKCGAIDSLKLWKIFQKASWESKDIKEHQKEMIHQLKTHYQAKFSADE
ncbi:HNH endonuclease [Entomomonas moraniae]|uniref:HNH endonuclease n=1 Tax=Entomomonas moraniae TaxID=2213226 RepID=A0A3Q9JN00_9GAMM|nr:HNH endonuclease [Entomomonas moraniae]